MDCARSNVNAAYYGGSLSEAPSIFDLEPMTHIKNTPGYLPEYDAYLSMALQHLNTYKYTGGTLSLSTLTNTVKAGGSGLVGWYHKNSHVGDTNSQEDHIFDKFKTFGDFKVKPDLASIYKCKGVCLTMYRTPYEALRSHKILCGDDYHVVNFDLDGCGREYYKCPGHAVPISHDVFRCTKHSKSLKDGKRVNVYCGKHFRYCTNYVLIDGEDSSVVAPSGHCTKFFGDGDVGVHNNSSSDEPSSWETAYTDDDAGDSADAGDDSSASTIVCNIQGCTLTDAYDPSDATAAALHAFCSSCYQYKCNGSDHSAASCGKSGHHVCSINSHVAASCGQSGHYNCDRLTHVEEQCTNTNANGDRCTYTFWRCLHPTVPSYGPSHTCTYPAAPPPAVFTPVLTLTYKVAQVLCP